MKNSTVTVKPKDKFYAIIKHIICYGNTVGSREIRHWNSKDIRRLRNSLSLSDIQKCVLVGKILGDGSIISNIAKSNYRLQVEQKRDHKEYVEWLVDIFYDWVLSPPRYMPTHRSWKFRTISHKEFTFFRNLFYKGKKKILPENMEKLLTHPIGLAVWYMDDGSLSSTKKALTLSTHNFSFKENEMLAQCLSKNFDLQANINYDGKGCRLYIPVNNAKHFRDLVDPYILPVMRYKIPLTP